MHINAVGDRPYSAQSPDMAVHWSLHPDILAGHSYSRVRDAYTYV